MILLKRQLSFLIAMTHIYILGLVEGKYYVGKTQSLKTRLQQHERGEGCVWTQRYPPIQVIETINNVDREDEDKYTLRYMKKYGIENVRGGSFSGVELSRSEYETVSKMIETSQDRCYRCGETGHFANRCRKEVCERCGRIGHSEVSCYARRDIEGEEIEEVWCCEHCHKEFSSESACERHERGCGRGGVQCYRCGRSGHYANQCYAKSGVGGYEIDSDSDY